jgi:DNA repair protein RadC
MMVRNAEANYVIRACRVQELPLLQQPRELVERHGAGGVEPYVLLAVILRTGTARRNVVELSRDLLRHYGSLSELSKASIDDLQRWDGMGPVKAQILKCSLELARRMTEETTGVERPLVRTPEDAVAILQEEARGQDVENFWVLMLDIRYRLIRGPHHISRGILDASLVHPREVFREAIRSGSAALVLAHNHPSGDPSPSAEDLRITRQLIQAGKLMDIEVLDHVILGRPQPDEPSGFVSLRESGLVAFSM